MSDVTALASIAVSALVNFVIIFFAAPALVLNFESHKQYLDTKGRAAVCAGLMTIAFVGGNVLSVAAGGGTAQVGCTLSLFPLIVGAVVLKVGYKVSFGLGVAISLIIALIMAGVGIGVQFAIGAALAAT